MQNSSDVLMTGSALTPVVMRSLRPLTTAR